MTVLVDDMFFLGIVFVPLALTMLFIGLSRRVGP
jgi:hypothetical protein